MGTPICNWRRIEVDNWSEITFLHYLEDRHEEIYGLPYARRGNTASEYQQIGKLIEHYGTEIVKEFIDECFEVYRPSADYPGVNLYFMCTYMGYCLQRVIIRDKIRRGEDGRILILGDMDYK
ncbi:hypothetical protein [Mechercharimyces sp. CAU 1602]|uniref:hypothetical protein n=1 Tax=Mechercharimyces sp. CAU 1602 TaxID=2973933 RepID=UPI002162AE81|nr:hypothetical protein [Mechercharimyces sp. CAU 1602]MCS1350343.1 hypothetical protein [Mechercharimyces sp. CAU 1602]